MSCSKEEFTDYRQHNSNLGDKEIAGLLLKAGTFSVMQGSIEWGESVDAKQNAFEGNMHHPVYQLYSIFVHGGFHFPYDMTYRYTGKVYADQVAPNIPRDISEVKMVGSPMDLIEHFLLKDDSRQLVKDRIAEANKVLLTGCVSAESAITLARTLSK